MKKKSRYNLWNLLVLWIQAYPIGSSFGKIFKLKRSNKYHAALKVLEQLWSRLNSSANKRNPFAFGLVIIAADEFDDIGIKINQPLIALEPLIEAAELCEFEINETPRVTAAELKFVDHYGTKLAMYKSRIKELSDLAQKETANNSA